MIRFIEPIVCPGFKFTDTIGMYPFPTPWRAVLFNRLSISGWVLRSCARARTVSAGKVRLVSAPPPAVPRDTLDVLYLSIRPGFCGGNFYPVFFVGFLSSYTFEHPSHLILINLYLFFYSTPNSPS